jgi:hypothetical protein
MKNIQSQIIANEFDISTTLIKCKVQNHVLADESIPNIAHKQALFYDKLREEEEEKKRIMKEEGDRKIKQNLKIYKEKKKEIDDLQNRMQSEKIARLQRKKELSEKIKDSNIKPKRETRRTCNMTFKDNDIIPEEVADNFTFKEEIEYDSCVEIVPDVVPQKLDKNVINLREEIDNIIKSKLEECKNDKFESNRASLYNFNTDVQNEINKNVSNIREFRKTGMINNPELFTSRNETQSKKVNESLIEPKPKKFENELERRRYTKALKNLMIEKFKEKCIIIPHICSCGQLQKKLDNILECKNISVQSIVNIECANNCIYYKNSIDYNKSLSDIIKSVKNLKFETFSN